MSDVTDKKLGCFRAVFEAFLDRPINYFPRVDDRRSEKPRLRSLKDKEAIQTILPRFST